MRVIRQRMALTAVLCFGIGAVLWVRRPTPVAPAPMVESIDLRGATMRQAMEEVARRGGVALEADWNSLALPAGEERPLVSFSLRHVSVELAAKMVVEYAQARPAIAAEVKAGRLRVFRTPTRERVRGVPDITRTYDVGFLLQQEASLRRAVGAEEMVPYADPPAATGPFSGIRTESAMEKLRQLAYFSTDNREGASCELAGNCLIVHMSPRGHREFEALLLAWETGRPVPGGGE